MAKLLDGLVVLDFTWALSGPFCTMTLCDLGARVIKVETPESGDGFRRVGPFVNGISTYFTSVNRGKQSITMDLKNAGAVAVVKRLVEKADVVVENFRAGVMDRLGLGYETLSAVNPRLVYLSLSGFGQTGPYRDRPAFDVVVQGLSGVMSINGPEGGEPTRVGTSVGDIVPGLYSVIGVLSALQKPGAHRQGQLHRYRHDGRSGGYHRERHHALLGNRRRARAHWQPSPRHYPILGLSHRRRPCGAGSCQQQRAVGAVLHPAGDAGIEGQGGVRHRGRRETSTCRS